MQPVEKIDLPNGYTCNVYHDEFQGVDILGDVAGVFFWFGDRTPHLSRAEKVIGENDLPTLVKYRSDLQQARQSGELPGLLLAANFCQYGTGICFLVSDAEGSQYNGKNLFWYCDADTIAKEWNGDLQTAEKYGESVMRCIFEVWQGEVYGYTVTAPDGREVDSCWGFVGMDNKKSGLLENATCAAESDYMSETNTEKFCASFMAC